MLFIYVATLQLLSQMTNFYETWYEEYVICGHSCVNFLISNTDNNNEVDVQMCDVGATLALLASGS
jgi:hypothetical protein